MPDARATIIIDAKDQSGAVFERMMASWRSQIEQTGIATAEESMRMAGGLSKVVAAAKQMQEAFAQAPPQIFDKVIVNAASINKALVQWRSGMEETGKATAEASFKMGGGLAAVNRAALTATDSSTKYEQVTKNLEKTTSQTSQGFKLFGMNIVDIAAKMYILQVAARNVLQVFETGFNLAELGASVRDQTSDFKRMLDQFGAAPDIMQRMHIAAGGLITDFELQKSTVALLSDAHGEYGRVLANSLPTIIEEARALRANNASLGTLDEVVGKIITGIDTLRDRQLRVTGILVTAKQAYDEYAKSIGASSGAALTAEQQQIALTLAVVKERDALVEQSGGLADVTDKYAQLTTSLHETKQGFGEFLDVAFSPTIVAINNSFATLDKLAELMGKNKDATSTWGVVMKGLGEGIKTFLEAWNPFITLTISAIDKYLKLTGAFDDAGTSAKSLGVDISNLTTDTGIAAEAADKFASAWHDAITGFEMDFMSSQRKLRDESAKISGNIVEEAKSLNDKLTDIHSKAAQDSFDVDKSFNERKMELDSAYFDSRAALEKKLHDLKVELGLEKGNVSPQASQLAEYQAALKQIESGAGIPAGLSTMLGLGGTSTIDRLKPVLIEQIAALQKIVDDQAKAARVKSVEDELADLDAKHAKELAKLQSQADDKLAVISRGEEAATKKATEESAKRVTGWTDDLKKFQTTIQENYQQAWLDAMISVTEKGSAVRQMLEEQKLTAMGATKEMIEFYHTLASNPIYGLGGFTTPPPGTPGYSEYVLQQYLKELTGRASGGSVVGGQGYIVGETGPELFMPGQSGTIIPNSGGNMTVQINAGAYLGSAADAQRFGNALVPILAKALQGYNMNLFSAGTRNTRGGRS